METNSDSIRCEVFGEKNESKRYVAARSGILVANSKGANLTRTGELSESKKKRERMLVDILPYDSNNYYAYEGDTVIGVIVSRNPEFYQVDIGAESHAVLNTLEFQNATRKDRPNYSEGTLVYCRVLSAEKFGRIQLSCINPLEKKAWNSGEAFFSDLKQGFVFDLPISFCRHQLLS